MSALKLRISPTAVRAAMSKASRKATFKAMDHLAAVSKEQVPLDKGPLKNSCYVDVAADGRSATVSYDTPYAVRQHEELAYQHQRGRKVKYLEDPVNDSAVRSEMLRLAQEGARAVFGDDLT